MAKQKFYAYLVNGQSRVVDNWAECEKKVSGVQGAKYKSFTTRQEAELWLEKGANYETKKHELKEMQDGIYFDAGTGAGLGVQICVSDKNGKRMVLETLGHDFTNNYGELLACKCALEIALETGEKNIFGDSKLVVDFWSRGFIKKDHLPEQTIELSLEVKKLRYQFEQAGGKIELISGDYNPADLGFHK